MPRVVPSQVVTFIKVAAELKAITKETATQADLAKDYRNLIHTGRSQRLGQRCDRGTALSALAAIEHVVRDLSSEEEINARSLRNSPRSSTSYAT